MIKKILMKCLNIFKDAIILIVGLIGFSFTRTETDETSGGRNLFEERRKEETIRKIKDKKESLKKVKPDKKEITEEKIKELSNDKQKEIKVVYCESLKIDVFNDLDENIVIAKVYDQGLGKQNGLKKGDVILSVNEISMKNKDASHFVNCASLTDEKKITFIRNDKKYEVLIVPTTKKVREEENAEKNIFKEESNEKIKKENIVEKADILKGAAIVGASKTLVEPILEKSEEKEMKQEEALVEDEIINVDLSKEKETIIKKISEIKVEKVSVLPIILNAFETEKESKENDIEKKKIKEDKKEEKNKKKDKEKTKELTLFEEAALITKITEEDIKEKELIILDKRNFKRNLLKLLREDERYRIDLLPFTIFENRMVRNLYKGYLLSNGIISARRYLGEKQLEYNHLGRFSLINYLSSIRMFEMITFDNLYQLDMLKLELQKQYGFWLEIDEELEEIMNYIDCLEARIIAKYQNLILKKQKTKQKILTKFIH